MPFTGTYWTTAELRTTLGGVSRQAIKNLADKYDWVSPTPGVYDDADVGEYLCARWRAEIAGSRSYIWHDELDLESNCPACGAFALIWPDDDHYKCRNGHSGELEAQMYQNWYANVPGLVQKRG